MGGPWGARSNAAVRERWSPLLAETHEEPSEAFVGEVPGVRRVWDGGGERKAIPYAESPLYGKVYARFVAKGSGLEEFRAHLLGGRIGEAKAKEAYRALAGGSPKAKPLEEKVETLGFGHLLEEYRTKAQLDAST